jgi:tRNA-2-methylthio-N6-dimethylallyladenosine synthase
MVNHFVDSTFSILTFGCQMNKHDSERIAGTLEALGSVQVESIEEADIVIFMTCCVREAADTRLFGQLSSMKNIPLPTSSKFKKRIVAIGGCIGQRDGEKLTEQFDHVDVVFGTQNIAALPQLITQAIDDNKQHSQVLESSADFSTDLPMKRENSWSAWLPITVGCNNFCTYCIVPYVRGREKSRPIEDIVNEAKSFVQSGVKEITLLGQNVNSYGRDLYGEPRFEEILDQVDKTGIERLRFVTSHPKDLTDGVIEKFGTLKSLAPSLHLPFQSGSNRILKAMNRHYTKEHYLELIEKLRRVCPDIALSTDIIVGFPGETEEDFQETYDLVSKVGFAQAFTFIYSPREGTPAAKMEIGSSHEEIQDRFDRLVELVQEGAYAYNQGDLGKTISVLVEGPSKRNNQILAGKSVKNQTVHALLPAGVNIDDIAGKTINVKITEAKTWYLSGEAAL